MSDSDAAITARYHNSEDVLVAGSEAFRRFKSPPLVRFGLKLLAAIFLVGSVESTYLLLFTDNPPNLPPGQSPAALAAMIVPIGIGCFLYLFMRGSITRWLIRWRTRDAREKDALMEWTITRDALSLRSPMAQTRLSWQLIDRAIDTPTGFLLFVDRVAHWLPYDAFTTADGPNRLARLIEDQGVRYYRVN